MDKKDKMKAIDLMIVLGKGDGKGKGMPKGEYEDDSMSESEDSKMCECPKCGEEFECENC